MGGVRQQPVLRIAAQWRPRAFKNSCLVTSAPAKSECRSCSHVPQTPAGEPGCGEREAETAEGMMSSGYSPPCRLGQLEGAQAGAAPKQHFGLPRPHRMMDYKPGRLLGV